MQVSIPSRIRPALLIIGHTAQFRGRGKPMKIVRIMIVFMAYNVAG